MSRKFEVVRIRRGDGSLVRDAARFEDGSVFVPGCKIEEGEEVQVDGEKKVVASCEPGELRREEVDAPSGSPLASTIEKRQKGCLLTFEGDGEGE